MSSQPHPMIQRVRSQRARHVQRSIVYRALFTLAGALITLGGVVMLAAPGPAFVVIPVGLAMLAMEFTWAERWLEWAVVKADEAKRKAAQTSAAQKALAAAACVIAAAAFVAAALLYDLPLLPV